MKVIKFRAWNTKLKIWGGDIVINSLGVKAKTMIYEDVSRRGDRYKINQYTGLKDKNGQEIYEGDIIKAGDAVLEVKWLDKQGSWDAVAKSRHAIPYYWDSYKIIGNIYENPELLK